MKNYINTQENNHHSNTFNNALEETLRNGAQDLLQLALEQEIDMYIERFRDLKGDDNKRVIIRNGYLPKRSIQTGIGPIDVKQPRMRDKSGQLRFTSAILPKYARKAPSVESVIPTLYLKPGLRPNPAVEL